MVNRTCAGCNRSFAGKTRRATYCTVECRTNAYGAQFHCALMLSRAMEQRRCMYCRRRFIPRRDDQQFCCKSHVAAMRQVRQHCEKVVSRSIRYEGLRCMRCGAPIPFDAFRTVRVFCSSQCAQRYRSTKLDRAQRRKVSEWAAARPDRKCVGCGVAYSPRLDKQQYCSTACRQQNYRGKKKRDPDTARGSLGQCIECGADFTKVSSAHKWCSPLCRGRGSSRATKRRRRNIVAGCRGSQNDYADVEIFERDGWRCHLCGKKIRRDVDRRRPSGATIDHLVPLSLGGADVRENVAAAHRACNVAKNVAAVGDQLRLIG